MSAIVVLKDTKGKGKAWPFVSQQGVPSIMPHLVPHPKLGIR